jgi:hypothetical protein
MPSPRQGCFAHPVKAAGVAECVPRTVPLVALAQEMGVVRALTLDEADDDSSASRYLWICHIF